MLYVANLLLGVAIIGGAFSALATLVRRSFGPVPLVLLGVLVAGGFIAIAVTDHSLPETPMSRFSLWAAVTTCILAFSAAPITTVWLTARSPKPVTFWRQAGFALASIYGALLGIAVIAGVVGLLIIGVSRVFGAHSRGALMAVVRPDNDFARGDDSSGRLVPVSPLVARRVDSLVTTTWQDCQRSGECGSQPEVAYRGALYQLRAPSGQDVYVSHVRDPRGGMYALFLYDSGANRLSPNVVSIGDRWMETPMAVRSPLTSFSSPWGSSVPVVVAEEPQHWGTDATALNYHYWSIQPNLELRELFTLEWGVADSLVEECLTDSPREDDRDVIAREPVGIDADHVRVTVSLLRPGLDSILLGHYDLTRKAGGKFVVTAPVPRLPRFHGLLTGWAEGCGE